MKKRLESFLKISSLIKPWHVVLWGGFLFIASFFFSPVKPKPFGDGVWNKEARVLADAVKGNPHSDPIAFSHSVIPTLYYFVPALLSSGNEKSKDYFNNMLIWNFCFFSISILLYAKVFQARAGKTGLITLIILLTVIPYFTYYQFGFWSEPLSFFLLSVILYGLHKYYDNKFSWKYLFMWAAFIGLLIATRPNFILVIPLIILFAIWIKDKKTFLGAAIALSIFFATGLFKKLETEKNERDNVVFLLEQIHIGMFFLRNEFTDWSFFNNEYRENSVDYAQLTESKNKIEELVSKGVPERKAYLFILKNEIIDHPGKAITHVFKNFIHGNSMHIGSAVPGKLSMAYIKKHKGDFLFNLATNIIGWAVNILALLLLLKTNLRRSPFISMVLIIILAFNIFNCISASEQRYLFPTKILCIFLAACYINLWAIAREKKKQDAVPLAVNV